MAFVPIIMLYYFVEQGMHFKVTVTSYAAMVERWILRVKGELLDGAPDNSKCVGLDYEYNTQ
jgi:hypothetical protein